MPLKDRQPFKRETLDINTQQLDKEYFYCKHTREIFKDYESLFQRVIQCNSLIWACSLTGRVGLTYQEAVESEKKARNILTTFPESLKQPVLYITTLTKRNRIGDLCDDVFRFVRDRYFVGEQVELSIDGERKVCEVTAVCSSPTKNSKSPKKSGSNSKELHNDPAKQKYELYETDEADEIQICRVVEGKNISRPRGSFSRNANKLFIKQHVTLKDGSLVVKESSVKKYELDSPTLKQITGNVTPDFASLSKSSPNKRTNGQMDITKALMNKNGSKKTSAKSVKDASLAKDSAQKKFEEERKKKLLEREKEKEQMREEKLLIAKFKIEWSKPRDDLECDDLKDLPLPSNIKCNIPNEVFGDALMILEFVHQFSALLKAKRTYPHGFTFEMLDKALENTDIDGPFNDLLQMLFLAVLVQQEEEGEEQIGVKNMKHNDVSDDEDDISTTKALLSAKAAATIPQYYHGTILRKMPLDSFTLTEMLRLHLLASGSEVFPRVYERGMYVSQENPGISFKRENPEIMKLLATSSVFQLNVSQRVKILNVLMAQLLTYESYRDYIEESAKKLKNAQYCLKQLKWARSRRGKEEKNKKKPEEKKDSEGKPDEAKATEAKPELTPEEKALEDAKFLEQSLKEEKELVSLIEKLQGTAAMQPIGLDRAYRRYWVFKSIGGIFVEDNDPFIGVCLSRPTPTQPASVSSVKSQDELPLSFMRKYLSSHNKDDKNGQSDKENESIDSAVNNSLHNHSKAQKLLSDANPRINSPMKVNKRHSSSASVEDSDEKDLLKKNFGICNSDPVSCPVHSTNRKSVVMWSVFHTEEHLNSLIANLNPRGFRESQLQNQLIKDKVRFLSSISTCPVYKLTGQVLDEEPMEARKSNRHRSVFYNIPPEEALVSTFRDAILENEDKLWSGALGVIKVSDRKLWREALLNGDYDMQAKSLIWSNNCTRNQGGAVESLDAEEEKILQRSSSPSIVSSPLIVDLASALLQVGQGIEQRYMISPLADDEKYKKQKQKIAEKQEKYKAKAENSNKDESIEATAKSSLKSPFQRWEESLMKCTSLSQLFIHLATLERSITWRKAVKHASCRICRKRGDPENMLLCDGCDGGFHMYCLKPPLMVVPTGDWFCPPCEPLPPKETRRAAKSYKELSDSEGDEEEEVADEEGDNCDDDEDNNDEEEAATGESNDEAEDEEDEEEENREVEDGEEEDGNEDANSVDDDEDNDDYVDLDNEDDDFSEQDESDFCLKCNQGGDLICCDNCPASFHLYCCDPPLKRIPRGTWLCSKCSNTKEAQARKTKSSVKNVRSSSPPEDDEKESRRSSNRRSSNDSKGLPLDYNGCSKLLTQLSQHKDSWPFLKAVTRKEAPDYHKIIKRPLDLGLIRSKLNNQKYMTNSQFAADVYLMFQNCEVYNATETPQYLSGKRLARYFQSLLRQHKLDSNKRSIDTLSSDLPSKRSRH